MRIRELKLVSLILGAVLLLPFLAGVLDAKDGSLAQAPMTVTDIAGRNVSVTVPVQKVVLGYAKEFPSFAAVAGEKFSEKIVGWGLSRVIGDQDTYLKFKEKYSGMDVIPDVGSHATGTFSVEKIITLRPDVVIFPLWMLMNKYEGTTDDIEKLAGVGIPTVFTDYWENPFENTVPSTLLLGTLLGEEKRSQEIGEFYEKQMKGVLGRLETIKKPKPRAYVENGSRGSFENGWTCGKYAWGVMVDKAGGINIAEGIIKRWGQMSPEYLLKSNPDVIIIAEPKPSKKMMPGYNSNPEGEREVLKAFTEREGWNTFNAVKKGSIYGVFDSYLIYNIYNFAIIEAIAKWFYPDEFQDLDPKANLREFHKKFLPVDCGDAWMVGIQEAGAGK